MTATSSKKVIHSDAFVGVLLVAAAILALFASNSIFKNYYDALLLTPAAIQIGGFAIEKPLLLWINDGLMAVFFFLVGLEIKREVMHGELSTFDKASLPIFAAIGGMAVPALVYLLFNANDPVAVNGWAIPAATDIAFALGFLALVAVGAPASLKIFLLAVAIIDDLGAIAIIALFYTADLSLTMLGFALAGVTLLAVLNIAGVKRITPYAIIGVAIWAFVLKSGVHATLAGVITALMIPMQGQSADAPSPLKVLEHQLHPWVIFMVLPLFAFANAGLSFEGMKAADLLTPVTLGVALGLFIGKPLGVLAFAAAAVKAGWAKLPQGVSWMQMAGVAALTGVGFTMSLFIGGLAFDEAALLNEVRLGVLAGSLGSGVLGCTLIIMARNANEMRQRATPACQGAPA
ncbi:Na+/H+ antiporter NhaA [Hyphococcus flavus]|uniref:Na(+)/H(+) antiporter NhaA n=1 Tax=Hyphococcus flavus TaxID=1866326 RepID=A0AAE9ZCD1_9PROT|nr:Na+/H+ antiporter NhaA [Hyphococcus flavus]WDI32199.1 Na+/H+ antiporter NhaA [Hyphococcus flavus]